MCLFGVYSAVIAAAEPVMAKTAGIARGVSNAVGKAISTANEEAKWRAAQHYEAREKFFNRQLSTLEEEKREHAPSESVQENNKLLSHIALLTASAATGQSIDERVLHEYFPAWKGRDSSEFNVEEVLNDLIVAVSQLSQMRSRSFGREN